MLQAVVGVRCSFVLNMEFKHVGDGNEVASHYTCYFKMLTKEYQGFNLYQLEGQQRNNAFRTK